MILAIDFDGTMTRDLPMGTPPVLREGCADALRAIHAAGHTLILHSVRFGSEGTPDLAAEAELLLRTEGLWTLFAIVWREGGKPYADQYLDDRAQRIGDAGRGLDGSIGWGVAGEWYGGAIANPPAKWNGDGVPPRLMIWRVVGEITIWQVDGMRIRSTPEANYAVAQQTGGHPDLGSPGPFGLLLEDFDCVDFTDGGNGMRFPWIPINELWIDSAIAREEIGFVAVHEAVERYWMHQGKPYAEAHEIAIRIEKKMRADPTNLDRELDKACGVTRSVQGGE